MGWVLGIISFLFGKFPTMGQHSGRYVDMAVRIPAEDISNETSDV
jgi:hypothetical protein